MAGPLEGVRVLDLSAVVSGPLTGALLADLGAEVIKVEKLEGDIQRNVGSQRNGFSGSFHVLNRGKRSIALDLKSTFAQPVLRKLIAESDVLIQNFRPGVIDRLGLGYETVSQWHPKLIYLSISGFGALGPQQAKRAYDPIIQTYSGMASVQGLRRGQGPEQVNQLIMDKLTASTGAQAVCAALFSRERSGLGEHIELSMLDTAVAFLWPDAAADVILQGEEIDHRPAISAAGQLVELKDGWAAFMILSDQEFEGFCRALSLSDLRVDDRFNSLHRRQQHRNEFSEALKVALVPARALDTDTFLQRLSDEHVPVSKVQFLEEIHNDPQVVANALLRERHHPVAGHLREARPAPVFKRAGLEPAGFAPTIGEHSEEILTELGLAASLPELTANHAIKVGG